MSADSNVKKEIQVLIDLFTGHHEISSSSALGDKLPTPGSSPPLSSHSGSPRLPLTHGSPSATIHHPGPGPQVVPHYDFSGPWSWSEPRPSFQHQQLPQFQHVYHHAAPSYPAVFEAHVKTEYPVFEDPEFLSHQYIQSNQHFPPRDSLTPNQPYNDLHHQFIPSSEPPNFDKHWDPQQQIKSDVDDLQDMSDFLEFNSPPVPDTPQVEPQQPPEFFWPSDTGVPSVPNELGGVEFVGDFVENLTEL